MFHWPRKVERWLEELWTWMVRFKDAIFSIALEPGFVGTKLLALKFLEIYVLLFTSDANDSEKFTTEAATGGKQAFNISRLEGGHPFLDPVALMSEANRMLATLLDLLQSASNLPGPVTIAVVNCLAAIARKRPLQYDAILSALFDFNPNLETLKGCHGASIHYSLRTAFLGFLRCTHPVIMESRDRLLRVLRAMNAGEAADQVVRQVDKMIKNSERGSRETRLGRDDQSSSQLPVSGDLSRKRPMPSDSEEINNGPEAPSKYSRYGPNTQSAFSIQINGPGQDSVPVNGVSSNLPLLDSDLTPVEQMIAMIGALLAEGERGAESLEILISNVHPDLLADIVITNMRHLPKTPPPLTRLGNSPVAQQISSLSSSAQVAALSTQINAMPSPVLTTQLQVPLSSASSLSDTTAINIPAADSKRDPRRDPRRLDPRRVATLAGVPSIPVADDAGPVQSEFDGSASVSRPPSLAVMATAENPLTPAMTSAKSDDKNLESPSVSRIDLPNPKEDRLVGSEEIVHSSETFALSDHASSLHAVDEDSTAVEVSDVEMHGTGTSGLQEPDQSSPAVSNASASEETCQDLPPPPLYFELTEEQQSSVRKLAIEQIIESYKRLMETGCSETCKGLLAQLITQIDADDEIVVMLQKHVVVNYQQQKGHELVQHVLYHLYSLMILGSSESSSNAAVVYEKFLLAVAKSLLDAFPASDKSFSRLLGEVPFLPDSGLDLLDNLCSSDVFDLHGKEVRDGERVTQGLGAVWSLILGRPTNRLACLDIALKCAVHSQDEIRAKAIRLVSNKLFQVSYITENIEQYATDMMLSALDQYPSDVQHLKPGSIDQRAEREVGSQETSISGSQVSDSRTSEMDSVGGAQPIAHSVSTVSVPEAQRLSSLFFALCTKKPSLLRLIFDNYVRAPKAVKQAFHRHIPILVRALGSTCSELLHIISDPPQGSENLLTLVLQILTQETTPSSSLIATVKHLYETKLKDATILIPMLSSLSKNEVLPIFPRLVDLPLEKFQMALAHILQGSAHTGPALTPVEVLVAIHEIVPERDGLALKKITDACSACFEQRTVFTQQVLAKALNHMVDQTPLPLLFMRTVIQAIDAFPTLVDFVMEILSKLVSKQVWRMPKLWVGFLKCMSQTRPHSFPVLLQLPPPQLESALNKYANLRGPLAAYAGRPSVKTSIPRSTLAVLGLVNEPHLQQANVPSLQSSDTGSSVHGTTLT
ncbi:symplekin isoform X3 [Mangifera indica]|uniref:symplekin isoform X3 n=1 Tax=Mangifera indica TaxID=29780 RepID=UPI001CFA4BE2|nr:symplekin isoform X3 [Mangifera indica]